MRELPQGWETVNLGKVAEFEMGQAPPGAFCNKEGNGTVFVKAGEFGIDHPQVREWTTKPLKFAHRGDVLICVVGATSGKLNLGIDCAIGRSVAAIRPSVAASQKIIYRQLQLQVAQLRADSNGTAQGVISKQMLAGIQLVLPPIGEQTRIANQLDTLLTRVQACNDRFDAIPALLKRFRQTVLDAAVSGSLSEDWRLSRGQAQATTGQRHVPKDLPEGWSWSCAEEIKATDRHALAIGPFGSSLKVSDYTEEGVPLVFVREIRSRRFSGGNTKFISIQKARELKAHSIQGGDLLITKMGDPPGDIAVYPSDAPLAVITADCVRLRVDDTVALAEFVGYTIVCTDTRTRLRDITAGVAQRKISLSRFRHFPLPLAPLSEQAEIVRRVETLFAMADLIEARCTAARAQAQRLTPLVLAKAFRGELVPQDPNDEPASALLARIASSYTAVAEKKYAKSA